MNDDTTYISIYTLEEALEDGVLVEILKSDWRWLTAGKPVVATASIARDFTERDFKVMWNYFVPERQKAMQNDERVLVTLIVQGKTVWVVEDTQAFTFMYPEEY